MDLNILHDPKEQKFYSIIDGKESFLLYDVSSDKKKLNYKSTFVPDELRGKHIAEKIVKFALDYARNNHLKIIPSCPFVARIIDRHPEYKSLVEPSN